MREYTERPERLSRNGFARCEGGLAPAGVVWYNGIPAGEGAEG